MSRYGMGMLDDTIKKVQRRKAKLAARPGAVKASMPAKSTAVAAKKVVGRAAGSSAPGSIAQAKRVAESVRRTPAQAAASKTSARDRVAARVAAAKKKKKGGLRAASMR